MDVNDNADHLNARGDWASIASKLAPTGMVKPSWEFQQKISMLRPTFAHRPALRRRSALTKQMIFSPSPTAGRKIRVYVLKAGEVYQK